jgi:DNA repair exonuclease SbcCD ATPase subunit
MGGVILKELEVQNFRTFESKRFVISPDQKIILLYGNNGFGKTSFFDAIEWGITGDIRRYKEAAKEKNEYAMLQNQLQKDKAAWVNIKFNNDQSVKREIVRGRGSSDYNQGRVEGEPFSWIVKPEWNDLIDFNNAFNLSHILTQELVSQFVRSTKDTDRYAALVSLFGLEGYKAYSPKIDVIFKTLETRKKNLDQQKNMLLQKIDQRTDSLESVSFDVQMKKNELSAFLNMPVSSEDEIKLAESYVCKELNELSSNRSSANNKLRDIAYLEQNWADGKKKNDRISQLNTTLAEYEKLGRFCKSLHACKWILTVKSEYLEYAEEKGREDRLSIELENFRSSPEGNIAVIPESDFHGNYSLLIRFGLEMQGKPLMLAKDLDG